MVANYAGTLLLVSHDRAFLDNVVTSTLVFEGGGKVNEYVGGYSDWLRQRKVAGAARRRARRPARRRAPRRAAIEGAAAVLQRAARTRSHAGKNSSASKPNSSSCRRRSPTRLCSRMIRRGARPPCSACRRWPRNSRTRIRVGTSWNLEPRRRAASAASRPRPGADRWDSAARRRRHRE